MQSDENISLENSLIIREKEPVGSGKAFKVLDYSQYSTLKKSIVTKKNNDSQCCARALVVAIGMADHRPKIKSNEDAYTYTKKIGLKVA